MDGALVLCHAVGQGGGCQSCCNASCYLLLHPVPWEKGAEPCQGWRPWGCHFPRAPSPIFHLWPLCSGHVPLSPAAPVYSGHQLLALSLVPRQTILSQRENPEGADVGQRAGAGSQQDHPSQCEMYPGPLSCLRAGSWGNPASPTSRRDPMRGTGTICQPSAPLRALHPPLSSYPAPVCQGMPSRAGQVLTSTTAFLSHIWMTRQNLSLPVVSTFSRVPAPVSSS